MLAPPTHLEFGLTVLLVRVDLSVNLCVTAETSLHPLRTMSFLHGVLGGVGVTKELGS